MRKTFKFSTALYVSLLLVNLLGCSKKETPIPTVNLPVVVYNDRNNSANYPTTGMAFDAAGNFYVTDDSHDVIRMVTPAGVITNIAGSGTRGNSDGTGSAAGFNIPSGLAVDAASNIYVADAGNNMIRKITPAGVVTTVAGNGTVGSADGKGSAATFSFPQGIAVDNNGNIYIADTGNDLIRKITPNGTVTTIAGKLLLGKSNGAGTAATFNIPQGLAVDASGNLYVADAENNLIREISPAGVVSTFAGSGYATSFDGTGTGASFDFPNTIAIDQTGNLYVTEAFSNSISKISPNGLVHRLSVSGEASFGTNNGNNPTANLTYTNVSSGVSLPNGIAVSNANIVYVADYGDNLIKQAVNN